MGTTRSVGHFYEAGAGGRCDTGERTEGQSQTWDVPATFETILKSFIGATYSVISSPTRTAGTVAININTAAEKPMLEGARSISTRSAAL